jgi:hypothetical protein
MDDARPVRVGHAVGRLPNEVGRVDGRQRTVPSHAFLEAFAVNQLHHEEVDDVLAVSVLAQVVGADDIRVIQEGHGTGLLLKAGQCGRRAAEILCGQNLDRTTAMHQRMFGHIDRVVCAAPQQPQEPILPQHEPASFAAK